MLLPLKSVGIYLVVLNLQETLVLLKFGVHFFVLNLQGIWKKSEIE